MVVAVVGSRTFTDWSLLDETLTAFHRATPISKIVSGGARGADSMAERWANAHTIPVTVFPAEWQKYGKRAGFIRNELIISSCDRCFAFWDGQSKGTKHDIDLCAKQNIPCQIIRF